MFTPVLKSVELGSIISSSSGSSFSSISSISSIAHHSHRDMKLDMDLDTKLCMNLDNIVSQTQSLVERHPLAPLPPEVGSYRVVFLTRPCSSVPKWKNAILPTGAPGPWNLLSERASGWLVSLFSFWYRTREGQLNDHTVSVIWIFLRGRLNIINNLSPLIFNSFRRRIQSSELKDGERGNKWSDLFKHRARARGQKKRLKRGEEGSPAHSAGWKRWKLSTRARWKGRRRSKPWSSLIYHKV